MTGRTAGASTVLLVEDNPADALLIEEALDSAPDGWPRYGWRHVTTLREAIEEIGALAPVCVLLDLGLPDAGGVGGVRRILLEHPGIPIVVLTGLSDPETARDALHTGAQDFLTKSADLSPELLARTISYAIERAATGKAVLESNQALSRFASMVAHDLRSPLAIASGMLELLERKSGDRLDDELHHLVDRSIGAIQRASDMVSDLLAYARAKRPDEALAEVDLFETAEWAAGAAGLEESSGTLHLDPGLPIVTAGDSAMRQVFQNLLSNAVRYADPERDLVIEVGAHAEDREWVITVTDNGSGIPEDKRELVFVEGERLHTSVNGLGLGLAAVRAVVERHGGKVWAESRPDGQPGTRIVFTLPSGT